MNAVPLVIAEIADELLTAGALAVVLTGSWVRGTAAPESDIDMHALGAGPAYQLERRAGRLVSVSWRTPAEQRAAFDDPALAGIVVPAWRMALLLRDSRGVAAALQAEARDWTWARVPLERRLAWAAEELTGYAEEVHKLVSNAARGRWQIAAVQRTVLALRVASVLAPALEVLCESEDELWELVGERMGAEWRLAQAAAFGLADATFEASCAAALELFGLAAARLAPHCNARQLPVIAHARALAARPFAPDSAAPDDAR